MRSWEKLTDKGVRCVDNCEAGKWCIEEIWIGAFGLFKGVVSMLDSARRLDPARLIRKGFPYKTSRL